MDKLFLPRVIAFDRRTIIRDLAAQRYISYKRDTRLAQMAREHTGIAHTFEAAQCSLYLKEINAEPINDYAIFAAAYELQAAVIVSAHHIASLKQATRTGVNEARGRVFRVCEIACC